MGLADLERESARKEKQGRKFGLEWECKITEQRRDERNGNGKGRGSSRVVEDPGELE